MDTKSIEVTSIRVRARPGVPLLVASQEAAKLALEKDKLVVIEGFNGKRYSADPEALCSLVMASAERSDG